MGKKWQTCCLLPWLFYLLVLSRLFFIFFNGILDVVIILLIAIALPKVYPKSCDDKAYDFNDGYCDGPEGFVYYSG